MSQRLAILCDVDGTLFTDDIGACISAKFADPKVREQVMHEYKHEALSLAELTRRTWSSMPSSAYEAIREHALQIAILRDAFDELQTFCEEHGHYFEFSSSGYDVYVQPLLEKHGLNHLPIRHNKVDTSGDFLKPIFPYASKTCSFCSNCKGMRVDELQSEGYRVIGIGDGWSDQCMAEKADQLFARKSLVKYCQRNGIDYEEYESFSQVVKQLQPVYLP